MGAGSCLDGKILCLEHVGDPSRLGTVSVSAKPLCHAPLGTLSPCLYGHGQCYVSLQYLPRLLHCGFELRAVTLFMTLLGSGLKADSSQGLGVVRADVFLFENFPDVQPRLAPDHMPFLGCIICDCSYEGTRAWSLQHSSRAPLGDTKTFLVCLVLQYPLPTTGLPPPPVPDVDPSSEPLKTFLHETFCLQSAPPKVLLHWFSLLAQA